MRRAAQMKERKDEAAAAIAARNAAVAELKQAKRKLQEFESARLQTRNQDVHLGQSGRGQRQCWWCEGQKKQIRGLGQLSRHQTGLSDGQKTISRGGRTLGTRPWSLHMV